MPKNPLRHFKQFYDRTRALLDERAEVLEAKFPVTHRFVHFWLLVGRSFVRNRCPVRASALSYTTLLSLIPLLAVMLGITGVFLRAEGEKRIDEFIEQVVNSVVPPAVGTTNQASSATEIPAPGDTNLVASASGVGGTNTAPESGKLLVLAHRARSKFAELARDENMIDARRTVARYINEFIQNTRSGTLGATGMLLLLWAVYVLLSRIEETMNDIWGAPRGRNWLARVLNYWAAITLGPIVLIFGLGLATGPQFSGVRQVVHAVPYLGPLIFNLVPLVLLWFVFTFFYQLIPNTKVRFGAAAMGGLVGAGLWLGNNLLATLYVSRVVTNFKVYGGLGLVPVFMLGLYFSWFILLFGAQVAYAWQNRAAYLQEKLVENVNQRGREFVAMRLLTAIGQRFQNGEKPATIATMSAELGIPSRLIQQVMQPLLTTKLVVEVGGAEGGYAPARPLDAITAHHILLAMRASSGQELATRDEPVRAEVLGEFARIQEAERQAASAVTMFALVNRAQARLGLPTPAATNPAPAISATATTVVEVVPVAETNARPNAPPTEPAAPAAPTPPPMASPEPAAPVPAGRPAVIPDDTPFPD